MESFSDSLQLPDLTVVAGYFAVMIGIGLYYARGQGSLQEFFGGGGKVPWWLSGVSYYMTSFSAFAFVVYSELAYREGLTAFVVFWMCSVAALLTALLFSARWRRAASTSALEFIEERYGIALRQGLAWFSIPLRTIDNGLKLFAIGTLVCGSLGLGQEYVLHCILFSGGVVFVYTFLGGLWAVVVTDFVQAIVMFTGVIVLLPLALIQAGGLEGIIAAAPAGFFIPVKGDYTVGYLLAWLALLLLNYSTSWSLVQRFYSVPTDRDARKVGYMVAVLHLISPVIFFLPALAARVFLPGLSDADAKGVYALICRELLPVGMIGMIISAMFSATMSTLSGEYNAIASVLTNDVYRRTFNPGAPPRHLVMAGRLATLGVGACCVGVALVVLSNPGGSSLFDRMLKVFAIFMPPIAIPILAGLTLPKVTNGGGILGLLVGIAVGLGTYVLSQQNESFAIFKLNQYMVPTTIAATLAGVAAGMLLFPADRREQERVKRFFENLQIGPKWEVEGDTKRTTSLHPLRVIGISTGMLGILLTLVMGLSGVEGTEWISLMVGLIMTGAGLAAGVYPGKR